VLIHVPKTGGSTIREGLWGSRWRGPVFGAIPESWRELFKFAFVRHPLDRLVSAWADFSQLRGYGGGLEEFVAIVTDERIGFDARRRSVPEDIRHHTLPQSHPFNGLQFADRIGRYEHYQRDLAAILEVVGLRPRSVPRLRQTRRGPWSEHLRGRTLRRALEFLEPDFEFLGYPLPARRRAVAPPVAWPGVQRPPGPSPLRDSSGRPGSLSPTLSFGAGGTRRRDTKHSAGEPERPPFQSNTASASERTSNPFPKEWPWESA
jgi:hypothetical protein